MLNVAAAKYRIAILWKNGGDSVMSSNRIERYAITQQRHPLKLSTIVRQLPATLAWAPSVLRVGNDDRLAQVQPPLVAAIGL